MIAPRALLFYGRPPNWLFQLLRSLKVIGTTIQLKRRIIHITKIQVGQADAIAADLIKIRGDLNAGAAVASYSATAIFSGTFVSREGDVHEVEVTDYH